jgi:hypothetical protein
MQELREGFEQAKRILDEFLNTEGNFERISAAGKLMVILFLPEVK